MFSLIKEIYLNNPKTLVTLKAEGNSHPVLLCCSEIRGLGLIMIRKLGLIPNPRSQTPPNASRCPGNRVGSLMSKHKSPRKTTRLAVLQILIVLALLWFYPWEFGTPESNVNFDSASSTSHRTVWMQIYFISFCFFRKTSHWVVTVVWMRWKESETWFKIAVQLSKWCLEKRWDSGSVCWMNQWPKKQRDQFDLLT